MLRNSRKRHSETLEKSFNSRDNKKLWNSIKIITNVDSTKQQVIALNEEVCAENFNDFFLRFHSQNDCDCHVNCEFLCNFKIDPWRVQSFFSRVCSKKAPGPNGLSASLIQDCSRELTEAFCPIFQRFVDSCSVPDLWKKSIAVPIPKISCPVSNKHYRPVTLSIVMKCFEKIMVNRLKSEVAPHLDPLQFAYKPGLGAADALIRCTYS